MEAEVAVDQVAQDFDVATLERNVCAVRGAMYRTFKMAKDSTIAGIHSESLSFKLVSNSKGLKCSPFCCQNPSAAAESNEEGKHGA